MQLSFNRDIKENVARFDVIKEGEIVASVDQHFDYGDTLCEVEVVSGELTNEEVDLIFEDGCVEYI
jgi:hypothetical protein